MQTLEGNEEGDGGDAVVTRSWKYGELKFDVHVDSECAEGSGRVMMMVNDTVKKHRSRTLASRAISTTEVQYYAVVTGASEDIGK